MSLVLALLLAAADPAPVTGPPVPTDHAADAYYDPAIMARERALLVHENGGMAHDMLGAELFELSAGRGRDAYRIEGGGSWGGDLNRVAIEVRGAGELGRRPDEAEADLLYSRALDPWFDLQAGLRQDVEPRTMTSLAVGLKGLAPYQIATEAMLFVSSRGDVMARLEASHEMRLTQRLLLVPRGELNVGPKDGAERSLELGARLHYAFVPRFAPYVGVEWRDMFDGADVRQGGARFVSGVRFWF